MTAKPDRTKLDTSARAAYPVGALFALTFVQLLRTRWLVLTIAALLVPVAFSAFWTQPRPMSGDMLTLWGQIFVIAYLQFVLPFIALFYGASLISAEREAQTLTYLVTRPVPRWLTLVVKYLAAAIVCTVGLVLSMAASYALLGLHFGMGQVFENLRYWFGLAGVAGVGILVYLAVFLFMGLLLRRPVVVGLIFILLWEGFVGLMPGVIRFVTLVHYLRSIAVHSTKEAFILHGTVTVKAAPLEAVLVVLPTIWLAMLAFSLHRFTSAEFHTNPDRK